MCIKRCHTVRHRDFGDGGRIISALTLETTPEFLILFPAGGEEIDTLIFSHIFIPTGRVL